MAITVVSHSYWNGDGPSSSMDTTGADLFVVLWANYVVEATGTISDSKGNSGWSAPVVHEGSVGRVAASYVVPTSVGSGHTFSLSGGSTSYATAFIFALAGANAAPYDQESGANAGSGTTHSPGSMTPSQNNCIVLGITGPWQGDVSGSTIDGGFTIADRFTNGGYWSALSAYLIQTTAAASNPLWTYGYTANDRATMQIAFKAAGASSAVKTINGLARASVKTVNGLAIASVKTINGLA